jgi:hypothetical protein
MRILGTVIFLVSTGLVLSREPQFSVRGSVASELVCTTFGEEYR